MIELTTLYYIAKYLVAFIIIIGLSAIIIFSIQWIYYWAYTNYHKDLKPLIDLNKKGKDNE